LTEVESNLSRLLESLTWLLKSAATNQLN